MPLPTPSSSSSLPSRPNTLAQSHSAHSSIRGQTKKQKANQAQKEKDKAKDLLLHASAGANAVGEIVMADSGVRMLLQVGSGSGTGNAVASTSAGGNPKNGAGQGKGKGKEKAAAGKAEVGGDRPYVKAVLTNPNMIAWPTIPPTTQSSLLHLLQNSLPGIKEYHVSRDRCNRREKAKLKDKGKDKGKGEGEDKQKEKEMFTAETDGVQDMDIRDHTKVSGSTANGALPAEDEFLEPAPSASPSTGPEVAASAPDNGGDAGQVGQKRTLRCGEAEGERPKKKVRVEAPAPSPGAQKSTFKAKEIPPPNNESQTASTSTSTTAVTPLPPRPTPPPLLTHLTCGINEVYKALERQIQGMREAVDGLVEVQPGKKRIKYGQGKGKGKEKDGAGEGKEGVDGDGDGVFSLRELMQEEGEGSSTGKKGKQGKGKGKKVSIAADAMDVDENTEGAGGDTAPHPAKQVDTKKQPEAPAIKPTIPLADIPTLLPDPLRIIFACKDDVNPPDLIAPLPTYCSTWNSLIRQSRSRIQNAIREVHALSNASAQEVGDALKGKTNEQGEEEVKRRKVWMEVAVEVMKRTVEVWVVTLPQGGEMKLAEVMGLRRVAVLALNSSFPGIDAFLRQIKSADLKPLLPPYPIHAQNPLTPHALPTSTSTFAPTQLKAIQTTTPKDPRAKKAKRMEEVKAKRVEKKEGRKKERERREKEGVVVGGMVVGGEEGREKMEGEKRDEKMWRNRIRGMKLEERRKKETVDFVPIA